jgi:hypothetical protein
MPRPIPHNRITIKERRENILMLLTKGMKGYEIAKQLGVDAALKLAKECNEALFKLTAEGPSVMHVRLLEERLERIETRQINR